MVKIVFKLFRVLGIIFGFGVLVLYIYEIRSMTSKYGFEYFTDTFARIRDIATVAFGIIFIVPFGKLKKINRVYKNIIFLFLIGFEVYTCIYFAQFYIQYYEWAILFEKEKIISIILTLFEIIIPLLNIYIFFCEVIKTNKESNLDDEVMSEFLDS